MKYIELQNKKEYYQKNKHLISKEVVRNYSNAFRIEYTHNSTAIEGNTLTLMETKLLLEDKLSIGGKYLREIYEIVNHNKAFEYVKECISQNKKLNENIVKDVHSILMENIFTGGIYRNVDVYISGARHTPPTPIDAYNQVKSFYDFLVIKEKHLTPVEFAAWTHAEFVRIHPFVDGNGRTSRLIMNFQLMSAGYLPISISKERRLEYFDALEEYACEGNLDKFSDLIAEIEERQLDAYINVIEQENGNGPILGINFMQV